MNKTKLTLAIGVLGISGVAYPDGFKFWQLAKIIITKEKKPLIVHKGGFFGGFKGGIPHCQLADREKSPRIFVASVYAGSVLKTP